MLQLLLLFLLLLPTSVALRICYWYIDVDMLQSLVIFFIAARISRGFILPVCQLPLAPVRGLIPCRAEQQQFLMFLTRCTLGPWKKHESASPDLAWYNGQILNVFQYKKDQIYFKTTSFLITLVFVQSFSLLNCRNGVFGSQKWFCDETSSSCT